MYERTPGSVTFGISLLALDEVDEEVGDVVEFPHALGVELGGGFVGKKRRVDRGIVDGLRDHTFVEFSIEVLGDLADSLLEDRLADGDDDEKGAEQKPQVEAITAARDRHPRRPEGLPSRTRR